ncbi:nucleotidyltransferase domain-containing protein [uncultured Erythrobacter sp.]|uniref:nucleotidyltransferase domain-containing protein n=1 Tax=uncultured Erythrobacter sp. TaxID=263913 RepID=UPI0026153848|nr:nucleotidyltransferase domain-containing protein [uncultured Erythrobacter sp.]
MRIVSTILFGSQARNDQSESSDTDLLLICLENDRKHVSAGSLSLFLYSWKSLIEDAQNGDLFVCHLVHEAKPLIDPEDYLAKLRDRFKFRASYHQDIDNAIDFAWFLILQSDQINDALLAKRALWCVRTVLIADAANRSEAIFAPQQLAERTSSEAGRRILQSRHEKIGSAWTKQLLEEFMSDIGYRAAPRSLKSVDDFRRRFADTGNKVAMQTMNQEEESRSGYT